MTPDDSVLTADAALTAGAPEAGGSLEQFFASSPFTAVQQIWLNGFFAGIAARSDLSRDAAAASLTVQVLYGSQTGNARDLSEQLSQVLAAHGISAPMTELDAVDPARLVEMRHVVVITSTYGEGEMPDNAGLFWEAFEAESAPRLEQTSFAVLALGDSGYDDFCQAGRMIDLRFEQLGATRLLPRQDCDVDFEEPAETWTGQVSELLAAEAAASGGPAAPSVPQGADTAPPRRRSKWGRRSPFLSRLAANRRLSGLDSAKEIRHYEFELGDSGIDYAAGDALAVVPENDPALISELVAHLGLRAEEELDGLPLGERMRSEWEIRTPSKELIERIAEFDRAGELAEVVRRGDKEVLDSWLRGRDVLDLLQSASALRLDPAELPGLLRPLQPRSYSISSSPLDSPDRIHLTIASVRHRGPEGSDRVRGGVCSTFLSDRCGADHGVGIFPQPNAAFSVPEDGDTPIIMIGPGTGVAPFRGFLHERAASGVAGENWLFFGDQHRSSDFIYEEEILEMREQGVLSRLDLAFSRDQQEKIYVQTRMRERGRELYDWLERGARVYVCGDASRMAKDVDRALLDVVLGARGRGEDDAAEYVASMRKQKRYVRDVY